MYFVRVESTYPFKMANPRGQQRAKVFRQALEMEIASLAADDDRRGLRKVARKLIELAEQGDIQAIKELADRIDGKVPQAIAGIDEDENLTPIVPVINLLGHAESLPAPEAVDSVPHRRD